MAKYLHAVLIDLSGTLHIGDELISNSKHALQKLHSSNIPYRYVTNTTKESKRSLVNRLRNLGLDIDTNEVYTSLTAAEKYVSSKQLRPHLMLTADALNDFDHLPMDEPNAVVIGLAPDEFQYENMNLAFQYLLRGAELIAIHKARYYKRENGLALGPGPFVSALEYATNTKATVIGKPKKEFFLSAIRDLNCSDEASIYMIGDDVRDDIDGAQKAGLKGILVRTGKYRLGDENKIHPLPHKVVSNFPEAVEYILDVTGKQL